jgi:nucleoside triphosphate pyrophosphatase
MGQSRNNLTEHLRQLVLASSSPRRRELVASLDLSLPVLILSSDTDEDTPSDWQPSRIVEQLALRKARATAELLPAEDRASSLIVGADTIVVLDGEALGKPRDRADAIATLGRLQGRKHQVFTGVACVDPRGERESVAHRVTEVVMKPLELDLIERYVDTGEPMDKAGSYGIQGRGSVLVDRIEGCYFNVVGLPLALLADMLVEFNIAVI